MTSHCLVFVRRGEELLLARKRHGFGAGRLVAPGGKVEPGETPAQAAVRELHEETGLVVALDDLTDAGELRFRFGEAEQMAVRLFTVTAYDGEPVATDELDDPCWVRVDALPLAEMWADNPLWLPALLAGERIDVTISYDAAATTITGVEPG
jgi:8-oxo-dGTP diphosphatase